MLETRHQSLTTLRFQNLSKRGGIDHFVSTRIGGLSPPPYESLNLGFHVEDTAKTVLKNRERLAANIGIPLSDFTIAKQVHSGTVTIVTEGMRGDGAADLDTAVEVDRCDGNRCAPFMPDGSYGGLCADSLLRSSKESGRCRTCWLAWDRQIGYSENGRNLKGKIRLQPDRPSRRNWSLHRSLSLRSGPRSHLTS